jgi:hypothetical protein
MSTENQKPRTKRSDDDSPRKPAIVLDYRGTVGAADNVKQAERPLALQNQPGVEHVGSPLVIPVEIDGLTPIVLQPGINVLERDKWDAFMAITSTSKGKTGPSAEVRQVQSLIDSGALTEITSMPSEPFSIQEMVSRTLSEEGLEWLETAIKRLPKQKQGTLVNTLHHRVATSTRVNYVGGEHQTFEAAV